MNNGTAYGAKLRKLSDAIAAKTGENVFMGAEHRGNVVVYLFSDGTECSGIEALDHMGRLLTERGMDARELMFGQS